MKLRPGHSPICEELDELTRMARTTEMLLPLWAQLYGQLGTPDFNFHVRR
jgi:hypothetical protein